MRHFLHNDRLMAIGIGGVFLVLASGLMSQLTFPALTSDASTSVKSEDSTGKEIKAA